MLHATTCSALPGGATCPSPWIGNPAPGGAQFPLTLNPQNSTPGNYTLTVTGTSSPVAHNTTATLQVWDFKGNVSPTSATVQAGGSANFNVTISSVNGFVGNVNLGCQPSSIHISCSFNPSSLDVPANGTATSTLTLTAGSQLASTHRHGSRLLFLATFLVFPLGALLLNVANTRRKWVGALLVLLALGLMPSCGGGSSGGGGGGGTPYSVIMQVSSGNYGKNAGTSTLTVTQ